jgi:hypothetical protein
MVHEQNKKWPDAKAFIPWRQAWLFSRGPQWAREKDDSKLHDTPE